MTRRPWMYGTCLRLTGAEYERAMVRAVTEVRSALYVMCPGGLPLTLRRGVDGLICVDGDRGLQDALRRIDATCPDDATEVVR